MVARGGPSICGAESLHVSLHDFFPFVTALLLFILLAWPASVPVFAQTPATRPAAPKPNPDGTVILVNNNTGDVYINLTSKDNVRPGMPFTCFDPRTGVTVDNDQAAFGNGSIEVMAVTDEFTRCRITRATTNRAIQPGDHIYNTVYHNDKNRPTHYIVFGDFDLDGDGIPTAAERDRLGTLIRASGGVIDSQLTVNTDYLVLGQRPRSPAIRIPADDVPGSIAQDRAREEKHYDELVKQAEDYAIPVLNTNRLLSLIGYYNQAIAHR